MLHGILAASRSSGMHMAFRKGLLVIEDASSFEA